MAHDDDNGFSEWGGYFEAKKAKLEEQFQASSDPFRKSDLFNGISIFVNGLVTPSADELKRIMMVHGGIYHHYERAHTKFIIASNLPDVKVRNMNTSKIISAQWVVDCVNNNRIVDYKPYLLYTNQKTTQPGLNFKKTNDVSHADSTTDSGENDNKDSGNLEINLGEILKELQQAAHTVSPEKKFATSLSKSSDISSTSNAARTAVDPEFLSEFYKKSRLHHIATLGSGFKQYVCELRQAHGNKPFDKRIELMSLLPPKLFTATSTKHYVMHIDMDCFFVSVGLKSHPELRGQPIAVTHSKGGSSANDVPVHPKADRKAELELFAQRFEHQLHDNERAEKVRTGFEEKMSLSEIASCSYEARAAGIRNGMFVGQALQLCPNLKTIPYDFDGYREVAFTLYNTVAQYTLNIEAVSCDEMFVELTDIVEELNVDVMAFVTYLREEVRSKTGCPCSAGVGENKLLARMATKVAKPNGQHWLDADDVAEYMKSTPLDALPGVGSSISHKLKQVGLKTCGDVQDYATLDQLEKVLGKKMALTIYQNCRGIDLRPLLYEQQRKSISAEVNYGIRFTTASEFQTFLCQLSSEVHKRLTEIKRTTKHISLKLMVRAAEAPVETSKFMGHGVCDIHTKSVALKDSIDDEGRITSHVLGLMRQFDVPPEDLRGIGIHLSKLEEPKVQKKGNDIKTMFLQMSEKQKDKSAAMSIKTSPKSSVPLKTESKPRHTVLDMLKTAAASKSTWLTEEPMQCETPMVTNMAPPLLPNPVALGDEQLPEFDLEALAELPEDIRREVLTFKIEYLRMSESNDKEKTARSPLPPSSPPPPPPSMVVGKSSQVAFTSPLKPIDLLPSTSKAAVAKQNERIKRKQHDIGKRNNPEQVVADYKEALAEYVHPALIHYMENGEKPTVAKPTEAMCAPGSTARSGLQSTDNMLLDSNYKARLADWVRNFEIPLPVDIELIHIQLCGLIEANELDQVYEVMKYLCRLIKSKRHDNCTWHTAYSHIEVNLQSKMLALQGYDMHFTESINCFLCDA